VLTCMDAVYKRNALDRLNADWNYTQSSTLATAQVRRWSLRWLALAGCESPADVLTACYGFDDSSDAALSTLLRIVHGRYEGRDLAARLVLQSLVGPAVRDYLPRFSRAFDDAGDAASALIAALVETIATYPLNARDRVKRRLLTRTRTILRREARAFDRIDRKTQAVRGRREVPCDPVALGDAIDDADELPADPLIEATEALAAAVRRQTISLEDARLVARHHLAADPTPYAELADELHISEAAVRQRCSRILRRVAASAVAVA
jgi:DNA-directed RNA polymerase specialized sigma24 family protein